jgi:hypothetical protein
MLDSGWKGEGLICYVKLVKYVLEQLNVMMRIAVTIRQNV